MTRSRALVVMLAVGVTAFATGTHGQSLSRVATTVRAVARYPVFYHDKVIAILGTPIPLANGTQQGLAIASPKTFVLAPRAGQAPEEPQEFRGRMFDIGRFASDDSRLGPLNLPSIIASVAGERWPSRETLFALTGASWTDPPATNDQSMRAIVLSPSAFENRTVTVRGRFRGRNLFGDVPAWPRQSEFDFVLQAADAAIWVLDKRPRGDGFDFSTTNRAHTGRWLEATGRLEIRDDLPVIIATSLRAASPEQDQVDAPEPVARPLPPPEIVFSAPAANELAVPREVVVRFQFSRPMRAESFEGQLQARYVRPEGLQTPEIKVTYRPGPMAVEVRFAGPLAPDAEVEVTMGPAIVAVDGGAFGGTTLRFTTAR